MITYPYRFTMLNCIKKHTALVRKRVATYFSSKASIYVAIVGSGPSAFYAAKYLLEQHESIKVDIIEKMPVPFGLVRYGVAPDHQDVKAVCNQFAELMRNNRTRLRFFGNIKLDDSSKGDIDILSLRSAYSAVLLAFGASSDFFLGMKGESLEGVISARKFVNWYNGHPDYSSLGLSLKLHSVKNVVIIGHGNVAIDCARILMKGRSLNTSDISLAAFNDLTGAIPQSVSIVGRRGHIQSSFTIKELRELTKIAGVRVKIAKSELDAGSNESSEYELKEQRSKKRIVELINQIANSTPPHDDNLSENRRINIRYLLSPKAAISGPNGRVAFVDFERTVLIGPAFQQTAVGTGIVERLPCQLLLKSVGYRSVAIPGIPFDDTAYVIRNQQGRVVKPDADNLTLSSAGRINGVYVTGWAKRGASGIIGSNITDAKETVSCIVADLNEGLISKMDQDPIESIPQLRDDKVVSWDDFIAIDAVEVSLGAVCDPPKPREKIIEVAEMLRVVRAARVNKT